ncbi:DUF938 domain-containing protein [Jannaschia sp. KMU-145]|uniref:DUF938 domain-containing protein n=1 Tax=Jannaschia halovivens TaxID=3388667 RepID=UPI00396B06B3
MIRRLDLPDTAGAVDGSGLLHAPSADRNREAILEALLPRLPRQGDVLELASGTGQHIAALAAHRPDLSFHPTEPDPERRAAIDARCRGLSNVAPAGDVDACTPGWSLEGTAEAVMVVNLLHLISDAEMSVLLDEAVRVLSPGGLLAIYGPFLRGGVATSPGDLTFDASLRAQDSAIGFKEVEVVETVLVAMGLEVERIAMPANNLMIIGRVPTLPGF